MREPQEIQDAEYEQILERVCAIDVAKAVREGVHAGAAMRPGRARRLDPGAGRWRRPRSAVLELGGSPARRAGDREGHRWRATSDYWRVWWVVLEAAGLKVQLVNARHVKNVPGRAETDKKDCGAVRWRS